MMSPVAAHAAAPVNDDIGAATEVSSLPYADQSSTVEATSAADDPGCGSGPSIWYRFTPATDGYIEANTAGSGFDTMLGAYTGAPGALSFVACNDDSPYGLASAVQFPVVAGTTYYFVIAGYNAGSGAVQFNVQIVPPPPPPVSQITVGLTSATVNKAGVVTISGTIKCDQEGSAFIAVAGRQQKGFFSAQGDKTTFSACLTTETNWSLSFTSSTGISFLPGKISITYYVEASNQSGGTVTTGTKTINVTRRTR